MMDHIFLFPYCGVHGLEAEASDAHNGRCRGTSARSGRNAELIMRALSVLICQALALALASESAQERLP